MPQGAQFWDASGNLIIDFTTRTGFVLGRVDIDTGNQSGSVTNSAFADGGPFFFFLSTGSLGQPMPTVSFSGTTMTWTSLGLGTYIGSLFYGIY